MRQNHEDRSSWTFEEGTKIAPRRSALRLLGGGRRYEAYLAWDEGLFSLVVAKILRPDQVDDPRARSELAREAEALERLQHPVLPRCFESSLDGDRPHLVMEFLDGPRLSTLIRRYGPLAVEQVLPLALQICSALHYMGEASMAHLDVKPKNVIMGAPPRLIDLSIARTVEEARSTRGPIGTDAYMAPEQCGVEGAGEMGLPADIWGLGVTLYEAISGALPFPRGARDGGPDERFPQLVLEPAPLPGDVSEQLAVPLLSCLEKRPTDRPTPAELADGLQSLAAALPRPQVLPRLQPRGRRRPRWT
ncbi:MAG: serine/threonine-protein kinase [Actinomycetota bacterium]